MLFSRRQLIARFDAWLSHVSHVVVLVTLYLALLLKVKRTVGLPCL